MDEVEMATSNGIYLYGDMPLRLYHRPRIMERGTGISSWQYHPPMVTVDIDLGRVLPYRNGRGLRGDCVDERKRKDRRNPIYGKTAAPLSRWRARSIHGKI